jgi:hypothetical protein
MRFRPLSLVVLLAVTFGAPACAVVTESIAADSGSLDADPAETDARDGSTDGSTPRDGSSDAASLDSGGHSADAGAASSGDSGSGLGDFDGGSSDAASLDSGGHPADAGAASSGDSGSGLGGLVDSALALDARVPAVDAGVPTHVRLAGLTAEVAAAVCGALYRCCDSAEDRALYFAPMAASDRLAVLRDRIPEDGVLAESDCPELVRDIYDIVPLGGWVREALIDRVAFNSDEADTCLRTLATASCGEDVRAALRDASCFGWDAPTGAAQRRAFARTRVDGAACRGISDGVGATLFGSCDPEHAFCCLERGGRCLPTPDADGTCHATTEAGGRCGVLPRLAVCRAGLECIDYRCQAPITTPLELGAPCARDFALLGECVDSFCDVGGTNSCMRRRPDGEVCGAGYECSGGSCEDARCAGDAWCSIP